MMVLMPTTWGMIFEACKKQPSGVGGHPCRGGCSISATGNEAFVTVTNADSPAEGLPAATEWCAKYGKLPRHSSSSKTHGAYIQNYDCVPRA